MNFGLKSTHPVVPDLPTVEELPKDAHSSLKHQTTLEGLIADDPFPNSFADEGGDRDNNGVVNGSIDAASSENDVSIGIGTHTDVSGDEGWITIPFKKLPENWSDAEDILSFRSLDRSFIFPGEQLHILACLSASKQDTEIITPFRVAAMMSKNGINEQNPKQPQKIMGIESDPITERGNLDSTHDDPAGQNIKGNGETVSTTEKIDTKDDISVSESLLRMEGHKQRTEALLERFKNSHFFVRIAESDEPLWSKRNVAEPSSLISDMKRGKHDAGPRNTSRRVSQVNAVIDRGSFDAKASGGMARNTVRCCSLSNGDIVVLLQVNVGDIFAKDPVLEVLQFEKYQASNLASENRTGLVDSNHEDPCGDLLKWLLPLDHTLAPPARPLSPPSLSSSIGGVSHRSTLSASSGSQIFSFGHLRSYSMSSLPQATVSPPPAVSSYSKPSFDLEDWDRFSSRKLAKSPEVGNEGLLAFRGVSLEPERFSVHCGLEGIYIPGRRWTRKLEIIQPVEIHSFSADCNTEDLLCVRIKNVSPAHIPDIVIFLDAITIIFEEAPKGGPPISLPIACIEAGSDHSLPNLALRRGEEHSFILKPANSMWREPMAHSERSSPSSHSMVGSAASNMHPISRIRDGKGISTSASADQYSVLVSCRCNYSERLFFKQLTSWYPRMSRDLMVSVASEMSEQTFRPSKGISQLPVQVLTLQASNLTEEELTLTVLAPASFTSPPSVVSLNSAPSTPMSPFVGFTEFTGTVGGERHGSSLQRLNLVPLVSDNKKDNGGGRSVSLNEQAVSTSDVIPSTGLGCTHLWLQSAVPLGCVPPRSTATVKLELLPLTDGIITLDTLQVSVKEKGLTYIPEHSLKIHATSSIATGIV
ncbi:heat-inducible transcription repressor [Tasmannia lanceolata]|uniref:heat-inducible transcription repressor n=1 Tax=Tasmannia lanceolata TaxID=3420 RepID=UPI004063B682